jgi:hypothetical protein
VKEYLAKENYDLIEEHNFFKEFQVDNDYFVGLGWVCVRCG